ncbi:unnamed protein product [Timema podura]|uniref:Uncharacterized protein n=1 Tax=Timema podura TaxID=61482 RepID=A0ABN7NPX7_TIMPD|nr:unnamed protein product [Timema podura]
MCTTGRSGFAVVVTLPVTGPRGLRHRVHQVPVGAAARAQETRFDVHARTTYCRCQPGHRRSIGITRAILLYKSNVEYAGALRTLPTCDVMAGQERISYKHDVKKGIKPPKRINETPRLDGFSNEWVLRECGLKGNLIASAIYGFRDPSVLVGAEGYFGRLKPISPNVWLFCKICPVASAIYGFRDPSVLVGVEGYFGRL